jgi:hypothetical protein
MGGAWCESFPTGGATTSPSFRRAPRWTRDARRGSPRVSASGAGRVRAIATPGPDRMPAGPMGRPRLAGPVDASVKPCRPRRRWGHGSPRLLSPGDEPSRGKSRARAPLRYRCRARERWPDPTVRGIDDRDPDGTAGTSTVSTGRSHRTASISAESGSSGNDHTDPEVAQLQDSAFPPTAD